MSHILHLGHQPTDIPSIALNLSTVALGFDNTLDTNGIRFILTNVTNAPFSIGFPAPIGDMWLGFRYVPPNLEANSIIHALAGFLEFFDANNVMIARVRPVSSTNRYHADAVGDTTVQGASSYTAPSGLPQWLDVRIAVGADITVDFYSDGVLQSTATAANTAAKGKPVQVVFLNHGLHGSYYQTARIWYYAHFAVLDGVSTIGRRFVRRTPNIIGSFDEMDGTVAALADNSIGSRVVSSAAGQRMSFSLTGPTGPANVSAIGGVHLKQVAQAGTGLPDAIAGFLRIGGVNHDAAPETVPDLAPKPVYSSWAVNPVDASPWSDLTLPTEVGILSA